MQVELRRLASLLHLDAVAGPVQLREAATASNRHLWLVERGGHQFMQVLEKQGFPLPAQAG
jgi:hypothetical protein